MGGASSSNLSRAQPVGERGWVAARRWRRVGGAATRKRGVWAGRLRGRAIGGCAAGIEVEAVTGGGRNGTDRGGHGHGRGRVGAAAAGFFFL